MREFAQPYRIQDPTNIFEVCENSSHPELRDCKDRVYDYKGRRFRTATECQKYLEDHGVNWRKLKLTITKQTDINGFIYICHVCERVPQGQMDVRQMEANLRYAR